MIFCPRCTQALQTEFLNELPRRVCSQCGFIYWNNPLPVAGAAVIDQRGWILLVRRSVEPRQGWWNLPAGFVEWGESLEEAARREVLEESGIDIRLSGFLTSVGSGRPDLKWHSLTFIFFYGQQVGGSLQPGDDADAAQFFAPDHLPEEIAFRSHQMAIAQWRQHRAEGLPPALGLSVI